MGYTFKSLCIRNFKYITNNKPLNDNEYYIVTNSKFAYEVEDNKD